MILEIDAGNTSLKWRRRGSAANSARDLSQLQAALGDDDRPEEVLVCNVRGKEFATELSAWLTAEWELRPRFASAIRDCAGVRIQYPDPSRLGADRWLAMLAGFSRARGACVIIDSGTAMTIDLLDADGRHRGGYIMPGLETSRAALTRNTSIRLQPPDAAESVAPGNDTGAAVRNGTLLMLCGAASAALERFEREAENPAVILTGGDAPLLATFLRDSFGRDDVVIAPDLVLDGLALALPDNAAA